MDSTGRSSHSCAPTRGRNGRVILNVGGKRFETLLDTLQKYPDTMLGAMFSPRGMTMAAPDENGEYFFDRDPKIFDVILNFYRHGKIIIPPHRPYEMVKEELDFFGISLDDYAVGAELRKEADGVAQQKIIIFMQNFLTPKLKAQATLGHYSLELGFVPEKYSMNNMTNLPALNKNSDYYELFSERENRKKLTKALKVLKVNSQWDRSEQVNVITKEFLFECFKLTVWWHGDVKMDFETSETASTTGKLGGVAAF